MSRNRNLSTLIQARSKWLAVALVLVANTTPMTAQTSTAGASILKQHYEAAQSLQSGGNLQEAARQYRIFIADALAEMALQAADLEQYEKAAAWFDESLRLAPRSPGLIIRYAQAALAAHDLLRARTLAEGVLRDYPENMKAQVKAHLLLGRALMAMNKEQFARDQFETAVRLDPSFENGYALAVACLDLGDERRAAEVFAEMVTGLGDGALLHEQIGRAYLNSDFQQKAVPEFQRAIAVDNTLPGAHYSLAVAYLTLGGEESLGKAASELKAELQLAPNDASTHAQLGNLALRQHQYDVAEQELKRAITLSPSNADAFFYLGQLYQETGHNDDAMAALRSSISFTPDPAYNRYQVQKAHYLLGRLLVQRGQTEAARQEMAISSALLQRSLAHDRNRLAGVFAEPSAAVAVSASTAPPSPAESELREFENRIAPALADGYNNLGVISAASQAYVEALTAFARAFEWKPDLEGLDANWGLAAFHAGRYQEAIVPLGHYLQSHPSEVDARTELAVSQFQTRDYTGTLKTLEPIKASIASTPQLSTIYSMALAKTGGSPDRNKDAGRP